MEINVYTKLKIFLYIIIIIITSKNISLFFFIIIKNNKIIIIIIIIIKLNINNFYNFIVKNVFILW